MQIGRPFLLMCEIALALANAGTHADIGTCEFCRTCKTILECSLFLWVWWNSGNSVLWFVNYPYIYCLMPLLMFQNIQNIDNNFDSFPVSVCNHTRKMIYGCKILHVSHFPHEKGCIRKLLLLEHQVNDVDKGLVLLLTYPVRFNNLPNLNQLIFQLNLGPICRKPLSKSNENSMQSPSLFSSGSYET